MMAAILLVLASLAFLFGAFVYFTGGLYGWMFLGMTDATWTAGIMNLIVFPALNWLAARWYWFALVSVVLAVIDGVQDTHVEEE